MEILFLRKCKMRTFSDEGKLDKSTASSPAIYKDAKGILQAERK